MFTVEYIDSLSFKNYNGSKTTISDGKGNNIVEDTRILEYEMKIKLADLRDAIKSDIDVLAPAYKQQNAALGLLSEEEITELKNNIQKCRDYYTNLQTQLLQVTECDQLYNINYVSQS